MRMAARRFFTLLAASMPRWSNRFASWGSNWLSLALELAASSKIRFGQSYVWKFFS